MDRELLLRARAGELEAFESIVLARGEPLFRTALAILGSEADARDATQETFIAAWRAIGGLRDLDRFDAWLGRALINECRTLMKKRGRIREIQAPTETADPSAVDRSREFDEAFARLSIDQRSLLVLHHMHGYDVREIAAWLGIPTGTVKWRLSRARRALKAELDRD
jgi:RNA polymerase sigma-70 factor (ECF subfamily)